MVLICIQENSKQEGAFCATVSFNQGPAYDITIRDPFSKEEEERLEWYFEEHLKFPFTDRVKAQEAAASITMYGETLFEQIFASDPQILSAYQVLAKAGLHTIQIEIAGSSAFHALHWEALKDPAFPQPLALQATVVRKNLSHQAVYADVHPSPTINLLIVTARPRGKQDIGYRTISRPLVESLRQDKVPVKIDILRPGTYKALENHLRVMTEQHGVGYYHIIHFDVHGSVLSYPLIRHLLQKRYGRKRPQPYKELKAFLFLEGEKENMADPMEATELADLLTAHRVPIVILNACQSGKQVGESGTSLASHLMQSGVQMVLAMGYSVTVSAAKLLMSILYQYLFVGEDLAVAIRHARAELYNNKERRAYFNQKICLEDWLLPVVYQNQPVMLHLQEFAPEERVAWFEGRTEEERHNISVAPQYGFVGRDIDVLQIEKRLLTKQNILLVQGMGGAGKSTLLHHLAGWWHTTGFVQRVFYFGYDERAWTLQQILAEIARQLYGAKDYTDFQSLTPTTQEAILSQDLRGKNHLLILDNLESITGTHLAIKHGLAAKEQTALHGFLADLANSHTLVLLGSRSREDWLAEGTFSDNIYVLSGLDPEAASTLAERILERHKASKYLENEDLRKLIKVLDGFPLALEVVLPNLAHQTPTEVLAALQAGNISLDIDDGEQESKSIFEQKSESILRCIDYSYSNLSPEAQQLLLCLAPFTSVIYLSALDLYSTLLRQQPVMASLPFEEWSQVLQEAMNWGLLSLDRKIEIAGFLRLQPVLPYFLRNRLQVPEQATVRIALEEAFRQMYDQMGHDLLPLLHSEDVQKRSVGQRVIELEYENFVTVLRLALKAQTSTFYLYGPLTTYLNITQDHRRGLDLGQTVLSYLEDYPADKLDGRLGSEFARVLGDVADRHRELQQYSTAETLLKRRLDLVSGLRRVGEDGRVELLANTYHDLGLLAERQRQWDKAKQYYQQALQVRIEIDDRNGQARTYYQLGSIAQEQRQWEKAQQYYQRALHSFTDFDNQTEQAATYLKLGGMAYEQRQWDKAKQYYQQALFGFAKIGDHYSRAIAYGDLASISAEQRQLDQAEQYYQHALHIFIEFDDRYNQAKTYGSLSLVAKAQRQWSQAEQYSQLALQGFIEFDDRHGQASTYLNMGGVAKDQRQWDKAERFYQQALHFYREFGDRFEEAKIYLNIGSMAQEQRQWDKAEQYHQQALHIFIELDDRYGQAETYHQFGRIAQAQGEWDKAEQNYLQALQGFIEFDARYEQIITYGQLGILARERKQWAQARDYYLHALEISIVYDDTDLIRITLLNLARLWQASGDKDIPAAIARIIGATLQETDELLLELL